MKGNNWISKVTISLVSLLMVFSVFINIPSIFAEEGVPAEPVETEEIQEEAAEPAAQSEEGEPVAEETPAIEVTPAEGEEATPTEEAPTEETVTPEAPAEETPEVVCPENASVVEGVCVCDEGYASVEETGACEVATPQPLEAEALEATVVQTIEFAEDNSEADIKISLESPDEEHTVAIVGISEEADGDITSLLLNPADLTSFTYPATADGTYRFTVTYQIVNSEGDVLEKTATSDAVITGIIDPMDEPTTLEVAGSVQLTVENSQNSSAVVSALNDQTNGSWMNNSSITTNGFAMQYTYTKPEDAPTPRSYTVVIPQYFTFDGSTLNPGVTPWTGWGVTNITTTYQNTNYLDGETYITFDVTTGNSSSNSFAIPGIKPDVEAIKNAATGDMNFVFKITSPNLPEATYTMKAPFKSNGIGVADTNTVMNINNSMIMNGSYRDIDPNEMEAGKLVFTQTLTIKKDPNSLPLNNYQISIPLPAGYTLENATVALTSDGHTYTLGDSHVAQVGNNLVISLNKGEEAQLLGNPSYANNNAGTITIKMSKPYTKGGTLPFNLGGEDVNAGNITYTLNGTTTEQGPANVWKYTNGTTPFVVVRSAADCNAYGCSASDVTDASNAFVFTQGATGQGRKLYLALSNANATSVSAAQINGMKFVGDQVEVNYDFSAAANSGLSVLGLSKDHTIDPDASVVVTYSDGSTQTLDTSSGTLQAQNFTIPSGAKVTGIKYTYPHLEGAGETNVPGARFAGIAPLEFKAQAAVEPSHATIETFVTVTSNVAETRQVPIRLEFKSSDTYVEAKDLSDNTHNVGTTNTNAFAEARIHIGEETSSIAGMSMAFGNTTDDLYTLSMAGAVKASQPGTITYTTVDGTSHTLNVTANAKAALPGVTETNYVTSLSYLPTGDDAQLSCMPENGCPATGKDYKLELFYLNSHVPTKVYANGVVHEIADGESYGFNTKLEGIPGGVVVATGKQQDDGRTVKYKTIYDKLVFVETTNGQYPNMAAVPLNAGYGGPLAGMAVYATNNLQPYTTVKFDFGNTTAGERTVLGLTGKIQLGGFASPEYNEITTVNALTGTATYTVCNQAAGCSGTGTCATRTKTLSGADGTIIDLGLGPDEYLTSLSITTTMFANGNPAADKSQFGVQLLAKDGFIGDSVMIDCVDTPIPTGNYQTIDANLDGTKATDPTGTHDTDNSPMKSVKFAPEETPIACEGSVCHFVDNKVYNANTYMMDRGCKEFKMGTTQWILMSNEDDIDYGFPVLGWTFNVRSGFPNFNNATFSLSNDSADVMSAIGEVRVYDVLGNITPTGSVIYTTNQNGARTIALNPGAKTTLTLAANEYVTDIKIVLTNITNITANSQIVGEYFLNNEKTIDAFPSTGAAIADGYHSDVNGSMTYVASNGDTVGPILTYGSITSGGAVTHSSGTSASFYEKLDQISLEASTGYAGNIFDSADDAPVGGMNNYAGFSYIVTNETKNYENAIFTMSVNDVTFFKAVNAVSVTNNTSAGYVQYQINGSSTWLGSDSTTNFPAHATGQVNLPVTGTDVVTGIRLVFPSLAVERESNKPQQTHMDVVVGRNVSLGSALADGTEINPANSYNMTIDFTADNYDGSNAQSATGDSCDLNSNANTVTTPTATLGTYYIPASAADNLVKFQSNPQTIGISTYDAVLGTDVQVVSSSYVNNGQILNISHDPQVNWNQITPTIKSDNSNIIPNVTLVNPKIYYLIEEHFEYNDASLNFVDANGNTLTPTVNYYTGTRIQVGSYYYNVLELTFSGSTGSTAYHAALTRDADGWTTIANVDFKVTTSYVYTSQADDAPIPVIAQSYADIGYNISTDPTQRIYTHKTDTYSTADGLGLNNPVATGLTNTVTGAAAGASHQWLILGDTSSRVSVKVNLARNIGVRNLITTTTQRTLNAVGSTETVFTHELTVLPDSNVVYNLVMYVPIPTEIGAGSHTIQSHTNEYALKLNGPVTTAAYAGKPQPTSNISYSTQSSPTMNYVAGDESGSWSATYTSAAKWIKIEVPTLNSENFFIVNIPMIYDKGVTNTEPTVAGITDWANVFYGYNKDSIDVKGQKGSDVSAKIAQLQIKGTLWMDKDNTQGLDSIGTSDEPLAGETVTLCKVQEQPCTSGNTAATATTDANGDYILDVPATGTYYVVFPNKYAAYPNGYDFVKEEYTGIPTQLSSKANRAEDGDGNSQPTNAAYGTKMVNVVDSTVEYINAGYFSVRPSTGADALLQPVITWEGDTVENAPINPNGLTITYRSEVLRNPENGTTITAITGRTTVAGVLTPTITGTQRTTNYTQAAKFLEGSFAWNGNGQFGTSAGILGGLQANLNTQVSATTRGGEYFYDDGLGGITFAYYPIVVRPTFTVTYVTGPNGTISDDGTSGFYTAGQSTNLVEKIYQGKRADDTPDNIPNTKTPDSVAYEFVGWVLDANKNGVIDDGETEYTEAEVDAYVVTENVQFIAQFRKKPVEIHFSAGDHGSLMEPRARGLVSEVTVTKEYGDLGNTVTAPTVVPDTGWRVVADDPWTADTTNYPGTVSFDAMQSTTTPYALTFNLGYVAHYERIPLAVTYVSADVTQGTLSKTTQTGLTVVNSNKFVEIVNYGDLIANEPNKNAATDYIFDYWTWDNDDDTATPEDIFHPADDTITYEVTVTAHWAYDGNHNNIPDYAEVLFKFDIYRARLSMLGMNSAQIAAGMTMANDHAEVLLNKDGIAPLLATYGTWENVVAHSTLAQINAAKATPATLRAELVPDLKVARCNEFVDWRRDNQTGAPYTTGYVDQATARAEIEAYTGFTGTTYTLYGWAMASDAPGCNVTPGPEGFAAPTTGGGFRAPLTGVQDFNWLYLLLLGVSVAGIALAARSYRKSRQH